MLSQTFSALCGNCASVADRISLPLVFAVNHAHLKTLHLTLKGQNK